MWHDFGGAGCLCGKGGGKGGGGYGYRCLYVILNQLSAGYQQHRPHPTSLSTICHQASQKKVCCGAQMATLDKAEALLEDLRSASWDAAVKDLEDVKAFAAKQARNRYYTPLCTV